MKIFLRPLTISDTALIVQWRNSEKVLNHCLSRATITESSHEKFFKENVETGKYKQFIVERVEENSGVAAYPIATVYLKDMDYVNKKCELCVFTSNDSEWINESQSIAIRQLIKKAFSEFGMHKVYSYVFKKNEEEIKLIKDSGFKEEAILTEEAQTTGGFEDIIRFCIINK